VRVGRRKILGATAEIRVDARPRLARALAANSPLPLDVDPVRLADVELGLATDQQSLVFDGPVGSVSFSAGGDVRTGLGVYVNPTDMLRDLADLAAESARPIPLDEIPFPDLPASRYFVLYWGYDFRADAAGSVALGAGPAVTWGARGSRNRAFIVIRAYENNPRAGTAVRDLLGRSWRLPNQIRTPADLQPGTWIVSEVTGSFSANLDVGLGLDHSWIRSVQIGTSDVLDGDVGLKIQAGVRAAFGLNATGRYLVLLGRDSLDGSARVLRLRLHRLSQRGWDFAFHTNLDLETTTGELLPAQLDDFIAAVLGIHGLQTLQELRLWTAPGARLTELASAFLVDYARNRLDEDFAQESDEIRQAIVAMFERWDKLPATAASALWDAVRLDANELEGFVATVRAFADPETVEQALKAAVADVQFAATPVGRWLLGIAEERLLGVVANRPEVEKVRLAAQTTLEILDGTLLDELQSFTENKVGFPVLRRAVEANDFVALTDPLKDKLAEFLGARAPIDTGDFERIRTTVHELLDRGADLYEAAVKSLNHTYKFSFDYAYSKQTAATALLDVSLDFGANPNLAETLTNAVAGDFTGLLPGAGQRPPAGVTFHEAALTHRIQRQAHVRVRLPFFTKDTLRRASSLGSYKVISEDGEVYFSALDATNELLHKGRWESRLSLGLGLAARAGEGIRRHDRDGTTATFDYRFVQAVPGLRTTQLERLMAPLSDNYFPGEFAGASGIAGKPSVSQWATALDKVVDGHEAAEDGLIGDSLMSLHVSLPGEILLKWLDAPRGKKDPVYMEMSRRFQTQLRRFIPLLHFQNPENYTHLKAAYVLLVYASLPVTTSLRVANRTVELNTNRRLYWDWPDESRSGERYALIFHEATEEKLEAAMNEAIRVLSSIPGLQDSARHYDPRRVTAARNAAVEQHGKNVLRSLLYVESELIKSAARAGRHMARFRTASDPAAAVKELAAFGDKLTRTFHQKLTTIFPPSDRAARELLRSLGSLIFAEVTQALDPLEAKPTAALEITVLKPNAGAPFPPKGFPEQLEIAADAVSVRQRVLEMGATPPH